MIDYIHIKYSRFDARCHILASRANEDESSRTGDALFCFHDNIRYIEKVLNDRYKGHSIYIVKPSSSYIFYDNAKGIWYCEIAYMYDHDNSKLNNSAFNFIKKSNKYSYVESERKYSKIYHGIRISADLKPTKSYYEGFDNSMKQRELTKDEIRDYRNLFKKWLKRNPGVEKFYFNNISKIKKVSVEELRKLNFGDEQVPKGDYLYGDECYGYKALNKYGHITSYAYVHPEVGIVHMSIEGIDVNEYTETVFYTFWMLKFGYEYDKKMLSRIQAHYTDRPHPNSKK